MTTASEEGLTPAADPKAALRHVWSGWLAWASEQPEKRRTLALLGTSDEITPQSHRAAQNAMAPIAQLIERCRADGPMRNVSIGFVAALMTAAAEATIDFIRSDPKNAARYSESGFEALWRMIG